MSGESNDPSEGYAHYKTRGKLDKYEIPVLSIPVIWDKYLAFIICLFMKAVSKRITKYGFKLQRVT